MTATQKIKHTIIVAAVKDFLDSGETMPQMPEIIDASNIDDLYDTLCGDESTCDYMTDAEDDFRGSFTRVTDLPTPSSRHYECKEVGRRVADGSWVGWTYWYGGGKHGEPSEMEWMDEAYDLKMEERTELVQHFTRGGCLR